MRTLTVASIVLALFLIALPAMAHSAEELEAWEEDWSQRFQALVIEMEEEGAFVFDNFKPLIEERTDWIQRHPCYFLGRDCPQAHEPPAPKASAPSVDKGMGSNVEQWRGLVAAYFPANQVDKALCVMNGESGGNSNADNPRSSALGLWQFLKSTWEQARQLTGAPAYPEGALDPEWSTKTAAAWLAATGWSQWNQASRC